MRYVHVWLVATLSVSCGQTVKNDERKVGAEKDGGEPVEEKESQDVRLPSEEKMPLPKLFLKGLTYEGTGCPEGTVAVTLSEDDQAFTMIFDEFIAEIEGEGLERKNCNVLFELGNTEGWSYAVLGTQVRGYASLDEGVHGLQALSIGGKDKMVDLDMPLEGPFDDNYEHIKETALGDLAWSPCGGDSETLQVNSEAVIQSSSAEAGGIVAVDSFDGGMTSKVSLAWRLCGDSPKK